MENAIYWKGRQIGIECDGRILWFPSAPADAIPVVGTLTLREVYNNFLFETARSF